jgi:hypothetical protein
LRYVYLIVLLISSVPAFAQMTEPFIEGDSVSVYPSTVRCFNHKDFAAFLKARSFRIIMLSGNPEKSLVTKVIVTNEEDVMVANIIPDNRACVLDVQEHVYFTDDFIFKEKKQAEKPPH